MSEFEKNEMLKFIAETTGAKSMTFTDPDGSNVNSYDLTGLGAPSLNWDNACIAEIDFNDIDAFLKANIPSKSLHVIPTDALTQLINAHKFAKTVPHGKHAFFTRDGGFCMRGYLTGGNGVLLKPNVNFSYPFGNQSVETIYGKPVNLSIFKEADIILMEKTLPDLVKGNIMSLNDTPWFDKDFALYFLEEAIKVAS
jgi:hypothetical protein